jgi:hypothetical protein
MRLIITKVRLLLHQYQVLAATTGTRQLRFFHRHGHSRSRVFAGFRARLHFGGADFLIPFETLPFCLHVLEFLRPLLALGFCPHSLLALTLCVYVATW